MRDHFRLLAAALAVLLFGSGGGAEAAIACNIPAATAPAVATTYNTGYPFDNITQATFTIRCRRTNAGDAASVNWTAAQNTEGLNAVGTQNRGRTGANRINYNPSKDSVSCSTAAWPIGAGAAITGTLALPVVSTWYTAAVNYWVCVPAGQATVAAGTYTDTMQLITNTASTRNIALSIAVPGTCTITTPTTPVAFTYTAFSAIAVPAVSTTFDATCTNRLPYTLTLDSTVGVIAAVGLQYSLSLSSPTSVGTGTAQTHTISGSMPAGQAGTCSSGSCSGSNPHTVTLTY